MTGPRTNPEPALDLTEVRQGLRLAAPRPPAEVAAEAAWLAELDRGPWLRRVRGWLSLSGPGYLQSALTLGAGTATSSLFAGALFGYQLLWVAPLGMLLGALMFAAIAHQTLSTGQRPLQAMRRFAGAPFAAVWAVGSLLASIVWHVPQYVLATASLQDLGDLLGVPLPPLVGSLLLAATAVAMTFCYGRTPRLIRAYESALKWLVWAIVLCLLWVVIHTPTDWGAVARGFLPGLPEPRHGQSPVTLVVSGLGAAVGINMVLLYPYSLLARGWGREHRNLARCDLVCGMWLPYTLATSLMVIAAANTLHGSDTPVGKGATIREVGGVLGQVLGPLAGRLVFDLGMLAMAFSTISLHMVVCGFVGAEWRGVAVGSWAHRRWSLLPLPACLAPALLPVFGLSGLPPWIGVPTNIVCLGFLPLCYLGFWLLQRHRSYLGADQPTGLRQGLWLCGMGLATVVLLVAFGAGVLDLLR